MESYRERIPFWDKLTEDEKKDIEMTGRIVQFGKGELLSRTSENCLGALFVISGQIRAYLLSEQGREVTLYRLKEDDICVLSASCLLDSIAFEVSISAVEDTEVLLLPTPTLRRLMNNVEVELFFAKETNDKFSSVMWTMQQILFFKVDRRVAIYLKEELERRLPQGERVVRASHEEIANLIGSAREVVSRVLKNMEEDGIVKLGRGTVRIVDVERLKTLAEIE